MLNDFLILMKQELLVTVIIFLLLFKKVSGGEWSNVSLMNFVNVLLVINLVSGFLCSRPVPFWRHVPQQ